MTVDRLEAFRGRRSFVRRHVTTAARCFPIARHHSTIAARRFPFPRRHWTVTAHCFSSTRDHSMAMHAIFHPRAAIRGRLVPNAWTFLRFGAGPDCRTEQSVHSSGYRQTNPSSWSIQARFVAPNPEPQRRSRGTSRHYPLRAMGAHSRCCPRERPEPNFHNFHNVSALTAVQKIDATPRKQITHPPGKCTLWR